MGYKLMPDQIPTVPPMVVPDLDGGTTSWRDAKKALRQWYLDRAKELRGVSEKDYFQA